MKPFSVLPVLCEGNNRSSHSYDVTAMFHASKLPTFNILNHQERSSHISHDSCTLIHVFQPGCDHGRAEYDNWPLIPSLTLPHHQCWSLMRTCGPSTHLPLDKMTVVSQTTFTVPFSWMKMLVFWFEFHWILFFRVQLTIPQPALV